jgi:hypothetical protein
VRREGVQQACRVAASRSDLFFSTSRASGRAASRRAQAATTSGVIFARLLKEPKVG